MSHPNSSTTVDASEIQRKINHNAHMKAMRQVTDEAGNALLDVLPPSYVEFYSDLASLRTNSLTRQSSIIEAALSYIEVLKEHRDDIDQHRPAPNNRTPSGLPSKNKTSNAKSVQKMYELNRALVRALDPNYQRRFRNMRGEAVCRAFILAREFISALEVEVAEKVEYHGGGRVMEVARMARLEEEWELERVAAILEEEREERQWWAFWVDVWRQEEEEREEEAKRMEG